VKTCTETTKDDSCCLQVVPGLEHCLEHARMRFDEDRKREGELLERMKHRAAMITERELALGEMPRDQERDRYDYLGLRTRIVQTRGPLAEALARNQQP
jgi:hypothetical protein